jgi:hypothetical protein
MTVGKQFRGADQSDQSWALRLKPGEAAMPISFALPDAAAQKSGGPKKKARSLMMHGSVYRAARRRAQEIGR